MKSTITNNQHSSEGDHKLTTETPPPALYNEDEMREVLGDHICDMPRPGSDEVDPGLSKDLEKPTDDFETSEITVTKSKRLPLDMLEVSIEEMNEDGVPPECGIEIFKTSVFLPAFITTAIDYISDKNFFGKKKACSQLVASGVTYTHEYLDTPTLKSAKINKQLLTYTQHWAEANEISTELIKSASVSIKKVSIQRNGEIALNRQPVYIYEKVRGYVGSVCDNYLLNEADCLRLVMSIGILKSTKLFNNKEIKSIKKLATKEIELILKEMTTTSNKLSHERRLFYRQYNKMCAEEEIDYAEKQMKKLDKIHETEHCKFCLSNDTKLRNHKRNQHKCQDCGKYFTPKIKK